MVTVVSATGTYTRSLGRSSGLKSSPPISKKRARSIRCDEPSARTSSIRRTLPCWSTPPASRMASCTRLMACTIMVPGKRTAPPTNTSNRAGETSSNSM